jgi:uncharacterized membrane protein (UPF0127 family)
MRTSRRVGFIFVAIGVLGGRCAPLRAQAPESLDRFPQLTAVVTTPTGAQRFSVWLADTNARSEQGLMFQHSLDHDRGMLFARNNSGRMAIWMKNTLIPLDILFVDAQGQIIYIRHSATPLSEAIISVPAPIATPAEAVLELAGGECERRHISQGDHLSVSKDH